MQSTPTPITKDLVFMGGGHSHAIALRMWGMNPLPGVRLTLINETCDTPYSGMLPGHVAGYYNHEECHIDLRPLAQFAEAQFLVNRVVGLDLSRKQVLCADRPPLSFDVLSIDIGSTPFVPNYQQDSETAEYSLPVKPIWKFLQHWQRIVQQAEANPHQTLRLGIVGGGVGGVELALSVQQRLEQALINPEQLELHLFHRGSLLLAGHSPYVQHQLYQVLNDQGIQLHLKENVVGVTDHQVQCESGLKVPCDYVFWVTEATAPGWLQEAGLAVDKQGFIQVHQTLQSFSHPEIFAAGDIATIVNHPRPKAGVFAVRQGQPLYNNLHRYLRGQPLRSYQPQSWYLNLIGTGPCKDTINRASTKTRGYPQRAIASWGSTVGLGPSTLLWQWKEWIDRRFMQRFATLPTMRQATLAEVPSLTAAPKLAPIMHCAGCGSKVGRPILERVLQRITQEQRAPSRQDILIGLDQPDDAAVIQVPAGKVLVQTVDYFRSLLPDPFLFGQIATHHALSDLFAMGAEPQGGLAIATLPYGLDAKVEESLYQLLSGAVQVLHQSGAILLGGHTSEGSELAFGLSCNGLGDRDRLLCKGGLQPGQILILTKALGTGTLFAADMQHQAKGRWIEAAIQSMTCSNQQAAQCFIQYGATACTDITGFGLVGHLLEMARASQVTVELNLESLPILAGAQETIQMGFVSSLHPQNLKAAQQIHNFHQFESHANVPLLFDPQTSGGLLAGIPSDRANACLSALQELGYLDSGIVGYVTLPIEDSQPMRLKN